MTLCLSWLRSNKIKVQRCLLRLNLVYGFFMLSPSCIAWAHLSGASTFIFILERKFNHDVNDFLGCNLVCFEFMHDFASTISLSLVCTVCFQLLVVFWVAFMASITTYLSLVIHGTFLVILLTFQGTHQCVTPARLLLSWHSTTSGWRVIAD